MKRGRERERERERRRRRRDEYTVEVYVWMLLSPAKRVECLSVLTFFLSILFLMSFASVINAYGEQEQSDFHFSRLIHMYLLLWLGLAILLNLIYS